MNIGVLASHQGTTLQAVLDDSLLSPGGELVVCDHLPEGVQTPRHRVLYMSTTENLKAFANAGFAQVEEPWQTHSMAMYRARI